MARRQRKAWRRCGGASVLKNISKAWQWRGYQWQSLWLIMAWHEAAWLSCRIATSQ